PDALDAARPQELGEEENRVGVSEKERCGTAQEAAGESLQGGLIHLERVQVTRPFQEGVAQASPPTALEKVGIARELGHPLAETPTAPLIRAQRAGAFPLEAFRVHKDFEGDAGRAGCLLAKQPAALAGPGQ